jgi:hypothetical protein
MGKKMEADRKTCPSPIYTKPIFLSYKKPR